MPSIARALTSLDGGRKLTSGAALRTGLSAYEAARHGTDTVSFAVGVYGTFVLVIAFAEPVVLTVAGILALVLRRDDSPIRR